MVTKVFDTTKVLLLTMVFEVFTDGLAGYKIHPNANSEVCVGDLRWQVQQRWGFATSTTRARISRQVRLLTCAC